MIDAVSSSPWGCATRLQLPHPPRRAATPPARAFTEVLGETGGRRLATAAPTPPHAAGDPRGTPIPHHPSPGVIAAPIPRHPSPGVTVAPAPRHASPVREVLVSLVEGERRLDAAVAQSLRGRTFTVQELIRLQATVLRHTQEVEVVSRIVDRLANTVRQTLTTQV